MIRPNSRLNPGINEDESLTDAASYSLDDLNCGFKFCGFSLCWSLKKYASLKKFVLIICLLGLLEGAINGYFLAHSHANSSRLSPTNISWLLVSSGITQGILALFLSYWGGSRHRPKIIGLFTLLLALSCFSISALLLTKTKEDSRLLQTDTLVCERSNEREVTSWNSCPYTIGTFFFLQFAIGVSNIAFMAFGIPYVDDNVAIEKSPQFIGLVLAAKYFGPQIGYAFSYLPLDNPKISASVWIGLGVGILLAILLVSLFPGRLITQIVKPDSINSIEFNRGLRPYRRSYYPRQKTGFMASVKRIFSIKMVVFNTLAVICVQTVIINFTLMRDSYLGSVFMISKSSGSIQSRLLIDILQPPLVALSIIFCGLVLRYIQPRASRLALWNIFVVCSVSGLMFSAVYLRCTNSVLHDQNAKRLNAHRNYDQPIYRKDYVNGPGSLYDESSKIDEFLLRPPFRHTPRFYLNTLCPDCQCPDELKFSPVCSSDGTVYYTPCHAGCRTFEKSTLTFGNCTCTTPSAAPNTVSNSDCYQNDCGRRAVMYQIVNTIAIALLASTFVINMLFCFRCVQVRDKPVLVGLEMTLVAIVAYVPGKYVYLLVDHWTCIFWHSNECKLHNASTFGTYLNLLNICFLMAAAGFYCIVFFLARNLKLYGEKPVNQDQQSEVEPMRYTIPNNHAANNKKTEPGQFSRNFRNSGPTNRKPLFINVSKSHLNRDSRNGSAQFPEMEREPLCWTARSTPTSEDLELNFNLQTPTNKMFPLTEFPEPKKPSDSRPITPSEFSQPRSPTEINRPKTPVEFSRPKTPNNLSRSRTSSLSSGPRSPNSDISKPKTPNSKSPFSDSEVELNFNLQTPTGVRSPGTTFRTDGVLTTLL